MIKTTIYSLIPVRRDGQIAVIGSLSTSGAGSLGSISTGGGGITYSAGTNICITNYVVNVCGTVSCASCATNATCLGGYPVGCFAGKDMPTFTGLATFCNVCVCGTFSANISTSSIVVNSCCAACPSIRFCDDPSRGIYKDTNNNIVSTAGFCACETIAAMHSADYIRIYHNPNNNIQHLEATCNLEIKTFGTTINISGSTYHNCNVTAPKFIEGGTCLGSTYLGINACAKDTCCFGAQLPSYYAPIASPVFTTCMKAPIVCASTCFVGCGAGLTGVATSLATLSDTCIVTPANYQVLQYNSTATKWCNCTPTDITAGLTNGQVLCYNGTTICSVATIASASLPIAAAGTLGGVKVGTGLAVDGSGCLCAIGAPVNTCKHCQCIGTSCITATAGSTCMADMGMTITPNGSHIFVSYSAPYCATSSNQTIYTCILVCGTCVRKNMHFVGGGTTTTAFHHMQAVTPSSSVSICIYWGGSTAIVQCGATGERILTVLDLP